MQDQIKIYTLKDYPVRVYVGITTNMVQEMNLLHDTTPTAAAAAGRTLTATALMASMLKNEKDVITAIVKGDGEIGTITATANNLGEAKCEITNPYTEVSFNEKRKLDVKKVVGKGSLTVIKDTGLSTPYVGKVELVSGEIAEDFTYYFATSEQTPSAVSLGVFVDTDLNVSHAGGFILQLMPDCPDDIIDYIDEKLNDFPTFTSLLQLGLEHKGIMKQIFDNYEYNEIESKDIKYFCDCSEKKIEKVLFALGREELCSIIEENEDIEVVCHFCNKKYNVSIEKLKELADN